MQFKSILASAAMLATSISAQELDICTKTCVTQVSACCNGGDPTTIDCKTLGACSILDLSKFLGPLEPQCTGSFVRVCSSSCSLPFPFGLSFNVTTAELECDAFF